MSEEFSKKEGFKVSAAKFEYVRDASEGFKELIREVNGRDHAVYVEIGTRGVVCKRFGSTMGHGGYNQFSEKLLKGIS